MREIRPYGSEGGGGETLPTPISSRWLSEATPLVMRSKKKLLAPRQGGGKTLSRVVVRWCRRLGSSTTGYWLRCIRHRFDQKEPFMTAKSINGQSDPRNSHRLWQLIAF